MADELGHSKTSMRRRDRGCCRIGGDRYCWLELKQREGRKFGLKMLWRQKCQRLELNSMEEAGKDEMPASDSSNKIVVSTRPHPQRAEGERRYSFCVRGAGCGAAR